MNENKVKVLAEKIAKSEALWDPYDLFETYGTSDNYQELYEDVCTSLRNPEKEGKSFMTYIDTTLTETDWQKENLPNGFHEVQKLKEEVLELWASMES